MQVSLLRSDAIVPKRATPGSAGYDLSSVEEVTLKAGSLGNTISTGIAVVAPTGTYIRIAPRSSISKRGIEVGAGVIDEDYRGEIKVVLHNHSETDVQIDKNARIAQMICEAIQTPEVVIVDFLDLTERGEGGFGSTG